MPGRESLSLLYVEDEALIRKNALLFLGEQFETLYEADNAFSALEIYREKKPDIIITDISMPKMSGLELCKKIRQEDKKTPIIITTAHTDTNYLLEAVELQLVKYLVKPINAKRLQEALELCFERLQESGSNVTHLACGFVYDMFNHALFHHDSPIKLTPQESRFFKLLLKYPDRICTYREIENFVFDGMGMSENALKVLVRKIRQKTDKGLIENHSKIGYKIVSA